MIKILIVEDQTLLRDSLEHIIAEQADMEVAGKTNSASKAFELCRKLRPDLVLMDIVTGNNENGITWTAKIRQEFPNIKIVIMTSLPEITFIDRARKAGAHSYIYKNSGYQHLFYVIRSTMEGGGIYPGPADNTHFAAKFTEEEIALIRLICQGLSRDAAADELKISEKKLKSTITSILDKTGFDSITKFAIYALGRHLIVPDL
jgi:DNA-binding NarL/FixJ family response regulator